MEKFVKCFTSTLYEVYESNNLSVYKILELFLLPLYTKYVESIGFGQKKKIEFLWLYPFQNILERVWDFRSIARQPIW